MGGKIGRGGLWMDWERWCVSLLLRNNLASATDELNEQGHAGSRAEQRSSEDNISRDREIVLHLIRLILRWLAAAHCGAVCMAVCICVCITLVSVWVFVCQSVFRPSTFSYEFVFNYSVQIAWDYFKGPAHRYWFWYLNSGSSVQYQCYLFHKSKWVLDHV